MRAVVGLVLGVLVAACAAPTPSPRESSSAAPTESQRESASPSSASGTVVVRQADLAGNGLYTEGANAFVEIRTAAGALAASAETGRYHLAQDLLRVDLPLGEYTLITYVRPCEAACPAMDPPTDGCEQTFSMPATGSIVLTIERAVGRPCSVDAG